jgi:solute carrier family 32 (vesicular inhibitory amino acid transporter)
VRAGAAPPARERVPAAVSSAAAVSPPPPAPPPPRDVEAAPSPPPRASPPSPSSSSGHLDLDECGGAAPGTHVPHHSASFGATLATLLALQLGWGLWLMPAALARLGWVPGLAAIAGVAGLTAYSASLFSRLAAAVPSAVLLADVAAAARGRAGRAVTTAIICTLDGLRCVILAQAGARSLAHAAGGRATPLGARAGAAVASLVFILSQARGLADVSWFLTAGTAAQLGAVAIVAWTLLASPDPSARTVLFNWSCDPVSAAIALLNIFFAFGGQFAYLEIVVAMRAPSRFTAAAAWSVALMGGAYASLGAAGYSSRGSGAADAAGGGEVVVFGLGDGPALRLAAGAVFLQALAQYLVSLVIWAHNLLTIVSRAAAAKQREDRRARGGGDGGDGSAATAAALLLPGEGEDDAHHSHHHHRHHGPRRPQDHSRPAWAATTAAVALSSWAAAASPVSFSALVGLVTASTYLLVAYGLPALFALTLLTPLPRGAGGPFGRAEVGFWRFLVGAAVVLSGAGLAASVTAMVRGQGGGPDR